MIVTVHVVVILSKLLSHTSMKYRVKSHTNMIDSFDSNIEKFFYRFLHIMASRYNRYITSIKLELKFSLIGHTFLIKSGEGAGRFFEK